MSNKIRERKRGRDMHAQTRREKELLKFKYEMIFFSLETGLTM
jgi:hypothetical protein